MPEFKHMHHSIDSKALLQVLRAQCALALSDGSRPPSVTRMHRKMFVRCISELCVYQNNRSENDKIRNKIKIKKKEKGIGQGKEDTKRSVACWLCLTVM